MRSFKGALGVTGTALQDNSGDPQPVGHEGDGRRWLMFLSALPLANVTDLGGPGR